MPIRRSSNSKQGGHSKGQKSLRMQPISQVRFQLKVIVTDKEKARGERKMVV
jgi:hypothetical protein